MSVYKQSRRDLSLPYALLSSKKKGSEYQHPESPFATVCTVAAGLQQVYYLLTVKFPRISWSSSNSEYLIHKIVTFHELKTVRWVEFITVRLHSPTPKPHKKNLILEDQKLSEQGLMKFFWKSNRFGFSHFIRVTMFLTGYYWEFKLRRLYFTDIGVLLPCTWPMCN